MYGKYYTYTTCNADITYSILLENHMKGNGHGSSCARAWMEKHELVKGTTLMQERGWKSVRWRLSMGHRALNRL
jgi:hypothetical protein